MRMPEDRGLCITSLVKLKQQRDRELARRV
jgi:hypothetical protein